MVLNNYYYIKITNSAEEELIEIYEYISITLKAKISADNFIKEIEKNRKDYQYFLIRAWK